VFFRRLQHNTSVKFYNNILYESGIIIRRVKYVFEWDVYYFYIDPLGRDDYRVSESKTIKQFDTNKNNNNDYNCIRGQKTPSIPICLLLIPTKYYVFYASCRIITVEIDIYRT